MKIGVISDTHLKSPDPVLEYILQESLGDSDLILHAGDIVSHRVLQRLEESRVIAVCGNMDDHEVADRIPQSRIVPAEGKRIGLMHGWGAKEGLARRVRSHFEPDPPHVIVFGHSHVPFWGIVDGTHMFNPGSAHQARHAGNGTIGVLEITGEVIEGKFLSVKR